MGKSNLRDKWYQRLKDDGFEDIEDTSLPDPPLKIWHNLRFKDIPLAVFEAKRTYFEWAEKLLHTHPFKSARDRRIWELHAQGHTEREIAQTINKRFKRKISHVRVHQIIATIAQEVKRKTWTVLKSLPEV